MTKSGEQSRQGVAERGSLFLRNLNIVGAVALTGAAVIFPEAAAPLLTLAVVDIVQAVFFDATAKMAAKRANTKAKPA